MAELVLRYPSYYPEKYIPKIDYLLRPPPCGESPMGEHSRPVAVKITRDAPPLRVWAKLGESMKIPNAANFSRRAGTMDITSDITLAANRTRLIRLRERGA